MDFGHDKVFRAIQDRTNGRRLVEQAVAQGNHKLAWEQAKAFGLTEADAMQLGISNRARPKGLKLRSLKAMGVAR